MYRDTSSVDCAPRELTHACSFCIVMNYMTVVYMWHVNMVYVEQTIAIIYFYNENNTD